MSFNLLRATASRLQTARKASLSDSVTYLRAGFSPITGLLATPGKTEFAIDDGQSVRLASKQQDWIITAADLVLPGSTTPFVPAKGDQIQVTAGAMAGTFEVGIPDNSDQPYQLDSTGLQLRIHTKRIA